MATKSWRSRRKHIEIGFDDSKSNQEKETKERESKKEKVKEEEVETKTKKKKTYHQMRLTDSKRMEPDKWKEVWDLIEEMRAETLAPVDTMGCEKLAQLLDPKTFRYQTLISLMLSSQTKDQVTAEAMKKLQLHGLTVENILNTQEEVIDKLITKVNFHKRKSNYIKRVTQILKEKYDSDIPPSVELLVELPGVGPKMAMLAMHAAWNREDCGIGVDVHVHRISNRLGWVSKTKNPEQTRIELQSWLPQTYWRRINGLLVGFGQTVCTPLRPKCKDCKVNKLCPSAFKV